MSGKQKELVTVATLYYEKNMTQSEIAKKLGVSRSLISKLLIEAKNGKIVEFYINNDSAESVRLELEMESKYPIDKAIVVDTFGLNEYDVRKNASQEAALYLRRISENVKSIGISWGKSLRSLVNYYPYTDQEGITVIPIIGGMSDDFFDIHSNQLSFDLARKMRGSAKYIYAPNSIDNEYLKNELINNNAISSVLRESKEVDIALVGIATPYRESTMFEINYTDESIIKELEKRNVVGDINSRFVDKNGKEVDGNFTGYSIGLTIDDLKQIPTVMGMALEDHKKDIVEVVLTNKLVNVIVVTDKMAKTLLKN